MVELDGVKVGKISSINHNWVAWEVRLKDHNHKYLESVSSNHVEEFHAWGLCFDDLLQVNYTTININRVCLRTPICIQNQSNINFLCLAEIFQTHHQSYTHPKEWAWDSWGLCKLVHCEWTCLSGNKSTTRFQVDSYQLEVLKLNQCLWCYFHSQII